jgi:hypothetical protein
MNRLLFLLGSVTAAVVVLSLIGIKKKQPKPKKIISKDAPALSPQRRNIFSLLRESVLDDQKIIHELKENPTSAKTIDQKGRLPLHLALSKPQPNKQIGMKQACDLLLNSPYSSPAPSRALSRRSRNQRSILASVTTPLLFPSRP